jgi:hypothetical protein
MGKVGDYCRGCDPGHHEPFLPNLLLPKHEKSRSGSRKTLGSQELSSAPFYPLGRNLSIILKVIPLIQQFVIKRALHSAPKGEWDQLGSNQWLSLLSLFFLKFTFSR